MPDEYTALVDALQKSGIPFAEHGWEPRPEGIYGVISLDFEGEGLDAEDRKMDRKWEASVDVFFPELIDRGNAIRTVEGILTEVCGASWEMNSLQHESGTRLFHIEWTCQVQNAKDG